MEEFEHTVRSGTRATIGVVTELVDVESSLSIGIMAGDIPADGGGGVLIGLLESHLASDLGVSSEDSNYSIEMLATAERPWGTGGWISAKKDPRGSCGFASKRRADKTQPASFNPEDCGEGREP